ncbi:protein TRM32-like [Chenopodium quinoa]|uniref:DUF4378 domain-containing protein n=1 Tax=Chenopodium quinoa TaxID=63459 RepID=A0A803LCI8_CHEQI|nr:protein TRM32-like [Chenopodium quinoa]XP_021716151.1 protein TRM32-like [Chenopodium quinoa]
MRKYIWRKHSYVKVEEDHPGCIWTVFQMFNYHPWHNVKKMLPYNKHKSHDNKSTKSKGIKSEGEHEINLSQELEEDFMLKYSASVNSGSSRNGSASKRSIKSRIRGLMKEKNNSRELDLPDQETLKDKSCDDDDYAPTLMSLLKANPKLIKSINHVDESSNMKPETKVNHKDSKVENDYVGVLELYKVDHDLFLRIMQNSPPKNMKLVKCGTFPSLNSSNSERERRPAKVEHKYNEAWPVSGTARQLKKAKSQNIARSLSVTEHTLDKYGYLFDSSSNKAIKKHLSKSVRLSNEKEFGTLNDLQGQRSFKDGLYLSEIESPMLTMNEPSRASLERWYTMNYGEARGLRLDSPRENVSLAKSLSKGKENRFIEEQFDAMAIASSREINLEICTQNDEIEHVDWPISSEGSPLELNRLSTFSRKTEDDNQDLNLNDDLQYVKYVLDISGLATEENKCEEWHSQTQPLDPALFDGIEVCCPFEPKLLDKDEIFMSSYHRKLVFDLINEALIDISERSYVCYPKSLSFWCHVSPTTKGKRRVVLEVWKFVREYLSWMPEFDPSLDVAVAHDLSKDKNGWVNLQTYTEGLALELEDLVFNELLDEIVSY